MKTTRVTINLDGLEAIKKAVGDTYRTRVGILGSSAARTNGAAMDNATIGLIQMFGSVSAGIPPRDFLLMPIETKKRELLRSLGGGMMRQAFKRRDFKGMFALLGIKAEEIVQEAFATGGFGRWAPLKPSTIARKKSSAILIDTAQLRAAITSDVVTKSSLGAPVSSSSIGSP